MEMQTRCSICRCYVDQEDLFCANCGTENPEPATAAPLDDAPQHHSFSCGSCGASMSYDAGAAALKCPYCASTEMHRQTGRRSVQPEGILPWLIKRQPAESILRKWLGRGFWRPGDAARTAKIGEMTPVYVPYWVFSAKADTRWTADVSPAPAGSRGDWCPVFGTRQGSYRGLLVCGSSVLTARETQEIAPFQLDQLQPADQQRIHAEQAVCEIFRVPRRAARPLARALVEQRERDACQAEIARRCRNVQVNVDLSHMHGRPLWLPVWVMAYQYRNQVYRVLINGQTGKIAGAAPFSYAKLTGVLLTIAAVLALIVTLLVATGALQ